MKMRISLVIYSARTAMTCALVMMAALAGCLPSVSNLDTTSDVVSTQPTSTAPATQTQVHPEALANEPPQAAQHVVKIDPEVVDFGEIATGEAAVRSVRLINTGPEPKTINQHRGKMVHVLPPNLVLAPGESRTIEVTLNGGATPGELHGRKYILVVEGQPEIEIPVRATAVSFVTQEPAIITPEAHPDGCIMLRSRDGAKFRIVSMQPPFVVAFRDEAAADHAVYIDWARYREVGIMRKIVLYFDHPRCHNLLLNVKFSPEELEAATQWIRCR